MQFLSQEMVQILQTMSQQRSDKSITLQDCAYALQSACLSVFPGRSVIPLREYYFPFGFYPECYMYYVVGEPNGRASVKWMMSAYVVRSTCHSEILYKDYVASRVRYRVNAVPSTIYPDLTIKEGEVKLILECYLRYSMNYRFSDGRLCRNVPFLEVFGFLSHTPSHDVYNSSRYNFFGGVVIFTPVDGLFSEEAPQ